MHVRTTSEDLARWLEREGGLWTVEGEPSLARGLPQPAPAEGLARAIRDRGGELRILVPDASALDADARLTTQDLVRAAHDVDGHVVFQLAWVGHDGTLLDSWVLAEHGAMTKSGERKLLPTSSAAKMIEALRRELQSATPRIGGYGKKPR
jgi:hypothetical protein